MASIPIPHYLQQGGHPINLYQADWSMAGNGNPNSLIILKMRIYITGSIPSLFIQTGISSR
jgi:hypothetical protein